MLAFAVSDLTAAEARFLRAIPQATIALFAARPVRKRYVERMEKLFGAEAAAALGSAKAPRAAASERDLLASYLFEPPVILAAPERPRSKGPDGTVDLEEHSGVDAELEASADWVARQVANGIPLEEIAVLVPELDPLGRLVADRLARLPWHAGDFPVHVADGLPFTSFAAGARILAVLRALRVISQPTYWLIYFPLFASQTRPSGTFRAGLPWIFSGLSGLSAATPPGPRALSNGRVALEERQSRT